MKPNDGLSWNGSDLNEVAELVDHPQPASVWLIPQGELTPNEWLSHVTAIREFADYVPLFRPTTDPAFTTPVHHAVGRDLVSRQN
jgi:hypothetical protein